MVSTKQADKGGMRVHHTAISNESWDAGEVERRLPADDERLIRRAFAWVDPDRPSSKSAAKFPHHELTSGNNVGPANVRACTSAIGTLNGARRGADIPASDRRKVYRHLASHLRDAGIDPPPLD
jgi:hypothetical protein